MKIRVGEWKQLTADEKYTRLVQVRALNFYKFGR